jgi:electron transfer flavoprotein alpha subunit
VRRIAVLVKQVPHAASLELGPDGRLVRDGLELEMNPYCRRAVAKGVELAREHHAHCTVITLGPPEAEDVLREAIAWGADLGLLVSDLAFAGSDTLATARALSTVLHMHGPWDLILTGRNSVDADTGQVGPQVAELLGLPFLGGVRELTLTGNRLDVTCEYDDGWVRSVATLPVVISCAERLCEPAKVPAERRRGVSAKKIRRLRAVHLGPGPWGEAASATSVGEVKAIDVPRAGEILQGSLDSQVAALADRIAEAQASERDQRRSTTVVPTGRPDGRRILVVLEPLRPRTDRELLGAAAQVASKIGGTVVAMTFETPGTTDRLAAAGADAIVEVVGAEVEDDAADAVCTWVTRNRPWAILAPATMWGRVVSARVAARAGAGLTGDAIAVDVDGDRLVGWKPAFGGALVAAIRATTDLQLVTVRPGAFSMFAPRAVPSAVQFERMQVSTTERVQRIAMARDDDIDVLRTAKAILGVGIGVAPEHYGELDPLLQALGGVLGATRRVTDRGWLPRCRQIGITGASVAPPVFVALGSSGSFNHLCGVRGAGLIVAVNSDESAPVFAGADVGVVGDWRQIVPKLAARLTSAHGGAPHRPVGGGPA